MTKSKIAFACYGTAIFIIAAIALTYLFTPRLLPYQEVAVGAPWDQLSVGLQTQFLSLLKVAGGGYLATAVALFVLLWIPFRQGDRWARTAIPALGIPAVLIVNYAGLTIMLNTPGKPPLIAGPVVILLMIAGYVLSADSHRRPQNSSIEF